MTGELLKAMDAELQALRSENQDLLQKVKSSSISEDFFHNPDGLPDKEKVKYYTGLPTMLTLTALVSFLAPQISSGPRSLTTKFQEVAIVLMRLRLNLPVQVLADLFHVSSSTVSRIFGKVLDVMYFKLKPLILWPDRESLYKTMPQEFRKYFGQKVTVIIDCFEIFY